MNRCVILILFVFVPLKACQKIDSFKSSNKKIKIFESCLVVGVFPFDFVLNRNRNY